MCAVLLFHLFWLVHCSEETREEWRNGGASAGGKRYKGPVGEGHTHTHTSESSAPLRPAVGARCGVTLTEAEQKKGEA